MGIITLISVILNIVLIRTWIHAWCLVADKDVEILDLQDSYERVAKMVTRQTLEKEFPEIFGDDPQT